MSLMDSVCMFVCMRRVYMCVCVVLDRNRWNELRGFAFIRRDLDNWVCISVRLCCMIKIPDLRCVLKCWCLHMCVWPFTRTLSSTFLYLHVVRCGSQLPSDFLGERAELLTLTLQDGMVGGNVEGGWVNTMKIKVVPSQLVPCGVTVYGGVSVSPQIL